MYFIMIPLMLCLMINKIFIKFNTFEMQATDFKRFLKQDAQYKKMMQYKEAHLQLQEIQLRCLQGLSKRLKGKYIHSIKRLLKKLLPTKDKWRTNQDQYSKYCMFIQEMQDAIGWKIFDYSQDENEYLKKKCELQKYKEEKEQEQINSFLESLSGPPSQEQQIQGSFEPFNNSLNEQFPYLKDKIYIIPSLFQTLTPKKLAKEMLGALHFEHGYILVLKINQSTKKMNSSDIQTIKKIVEQSKKSMTGEFQIDYPNEIISVQEKYSIFIIQVKSSPKKYTPYQYKEFIDSESVKVFFSLRKNWDFKDILLEQQRKLTENNILTMQGLNLKSSLFKKPYWYVLVEENLQQQTIIYQFSMTNQDDCQSLITNLITNKMTDILCIKKQIIEILTIEKIGSNFYQIYKQGDLKKYKLLGEKTLNQIYQYLISGKLDNTIRLKLNDNVNNQLKNYFGNLGYKIILDQQGNILEQQFIYQKWFIHKKLSNNCEYYRRMMEESKKKSKEMKSN